MQLMVTTMHEKPVLDGFCEVIVHTNNYFNEKKVHHMLTLYTLFVDVVSCYVRKGQCTDALQVLLKMHIFVNSNTRFPVLVDTLHVLKT